METIKVMNPSISKWQTKAVDSTPFCSLTPHTITPKQAEIYLRHNINRKIKPSRITKLIRDIRENNFHITNDIICFDKDGVLLNGQHRLTACVKANKPIKSFVGYGYTKNEQSCMDTGVSRSLYDVAILEGIDITRFEASIARFVRCQTIVGNIPRRATRPEEVEFVRRHYKMLKETSSIVENNKINKVERTGIRIGNDIGAAFFRALSFYKDQPEKIAIIRKFAMALLKESDYAQVSAQYGILGNPIVDRNRGLLVRYFRKYIEDSKKLMRRGGQDQTGRDVKYKMAEKYIEAFIDPPKRLMKMVRLPKDNSERYLLPEEKSIEN